MKETSKVEINLREDSLAGRIAKIMSKNIDISNTKRLEVDIMEMPPNCVIVVSGGVAKIRELPPFGEFKIVTHQGQVKRMRKEEGEEF